jgi:UDP-2,3-diacylglucosamine hydrolase
MTKVTAKAQSKTVALFVSDVHLQASLPKTTAAFFDFLHQHARTAQQLYLMGDLFEYWAGDDDLDDPLNARVASGLQDLVAAGVPVYLMHGNRDFLMLAGFTRASGARLLVDPTVVDLYGTPTLLLHGDTLCTDDTSYQALRRKLRSRWRQRVFLLQPLWLRHAEIRRGRGMSERAKQIKPAEIMDVTPAAVEQAFRDSGCTRMIHGHTHRPARHIHLVDGRSCERWVLSDWYQHGQYLLVGPDGCRPVELA